MWGKKHHSLIVGVLLLGAGNTMAEVDLATMEFSGFADILWNLDDGADESEDFAIGQAEIDLATTLGDRINLEMALAYDPDSGTFGLGALVMELALLGRDESHFHHSDVIENAGLVVGRMDVPFGIDWMFYPSIDRQLITGPLAVSGTHDGWNDLGVAGYLETSRFNGIVYRLNGSGYGAPYLPDEAAGGEIASAWGARVGATVLTGFEVGGSWAGISTVDGEQISAMWGVDAQWAAGPFSAKGEYIGQSVGEETSDKREHSGSYLEGMYHPESWFVLARYGIFEPDGDQWTRESRICLGVGYVVQPGAELRFEQQLGLDELDDRSVAQLVIGF